MKKEPESNHRKKIGAAAECLFARRGITATTMNDIAKEAGYSKATLYVYFADKEEIVSYLVLKSMKTLDIYISEAVGCQVTTKETYHKICRALVSFQEQYPFYFTLALSEINVNFEKEDYLPVEKETFEVGEQINQKIEAFIHQGIQAGDLQPDIPVLQTAFLFWAALAGLIQLSVNKRTYLEKSIHVPSEQFLEDGFKMLYRMISKETHT